MPLASRDTRSSGKPAGAADHALKRLEIGVVPEAPYMVKIRVCDPGVKTVGPRLLSADVGTASGCRAHVEHCSKNIYIYI